MGLPGHGKAARRPWSLTWEGVGLRLPKEQGAAAHSVLHPLVEGAGVGVGVGMPPLLSFSFFSTSMAGTWSSCWTAPPSCPGLSVSGWPWTLPVVCATSTARASSTVTSPPRYVGWAGRPSRQASALPARVAHRPSFSPLQNCLVRCDDNGYTAVVGDFGLAEKIPTYR